MNQLNIQSVMEFIENYRSDWKSHVIRKLRSRFHSSFRQNYLWRSSYLFLNLLRLCYKANEDGMLEIHHIASYVGGLLIIVKAIPPRN